MNARPNIERVTLLPERPARSAAGHKGSFGRVLIIAGSRGMSGAACLSGLGALRGGAGLVYVAAPEGVIPVVAAVEPSYLTVPLSEDAQGRLSIDALDTLESLAEKQSVVAVGPGCGRSPDVTSIVSRLYTSLDKPLVVDADGLNALSECRELIAGPPAPRVLTPHPGEFARLIDSDVATIQKNREEAAARFARDHGVVLLLKGQGTVVTDGRRLAVNTTGNSGLATGGTGDVLTGLISALLAQGMEPFEAARLAAHLHGLAADLAAEELSQPGMIASDLPRYLARAWKQIDEERAK